MLYKICLAIDGLDYTSCKLVNHRIHFLTKWMIKLNTSNHSGNEDPNSMYEKILLQIFKSIKYYYYK